MERRSVGISSRAKQIIAVGLILSSTSARAEWIRIGETTSNAVWMSDPARIRDVGSVKQIWIKVDHSKDASVAFRSSMRLYGVNCDAQTYKLLSYSEYDSYGKTVNSQTFPSYTTYDYSPVIPETLIETVTTAACARAD